MPYLDRSLDMILSYLEDLGLLCRRDYVSQKDVSDIIGAGIAEIIEIMMPYIERERAEADEGPPAYANTVYANTIWLYERVKTAKQFGLPGYGTPKLFFRRIANRP